MKWKQLLPGVLGVAGALLLALPSEAARLQSWRFNARENQLTFSTDTPVQPRAQLIFSPTRLVIDLPGTSLGRSATDRSVGRGVREVRVGQFEAQTTRIVIELEPGYILDPQQIVVQGETSRDWRVQIPQPQRGDPPNNAPTTAAAAAQNSVSRESAEAATQIQGIVATADGFFVRTRGAVPEISVRRTAERHDRNRKIIIEVSDAAIAAGLTQQSLPRNRYSISGWEVTQTSISPPQVEITLSLADSSPDWAVRASDIGGVVILPEGVSIRDVADSGSPTAGRSVAVSPAPDEIAEADVRPPSPPPADAPEVPPAPAELPQVRRGRYVVVLDPGHGGRDPGAVGIGGLQEKEVIFPITQQVAELLSEQGVEVVLTRTGDYELDLEPRVRIAERANATVFVSIHANAINLSRPDVNGLETYYYSSEGARFARTVHNIVLRELGMRDRSVRQARFYVIRNTSMPAILIETGFVTGAEDAPNLRDPLWQTRMAAAIAQGILTYLQR
ncbi:MAG: N-acetylmuramoyl-L-alanine amidase [Leptolyngbya sp. SIO4C1]|nr:N-acetylmuramoyl-L-alanine amidase [Leptolyngbya sp. SIO4C1]